MAFLGLALTLPAGRLKAAEGPSGEQIYRDRCASCHGVAGEGNPEEYAQPLAGDRSVSQLERLIAKTMPADDPGTCTGPEAQAVASYIYEAFYSPMAQVRNKPARVELSRLTVRQYRNAVADLIGTFRDPGHWGDRRGLRGEYFKSRRFREGERVIDRLDPEVRFDFGTEGPDPEKFEPSQFSIRWAGSVLAHETGEYEFIVRTEHAARLWVNDTKRPLIDAWVKSGNDTEYRASITLLGGRAYPLRLEFSKAKQGVDDSKDKKKKPPAVKASIALEWKPPRRAPEVIPARNLAPDRSPETFVVHAAFPPDDRSTGYERGTSVSKEWDQAATEAAIETADYVATRLRDLAGVRDDDPDREARLRDFGLRLVERAFRRPLTDDQRALYIDRQFTSSGDLEAAVKRCVLLALKSPRFLYLGLGGGDAYETAARISFGIWDSLPDRELLQAASNGQLSTPEQVSGQVARMVPDLRTRAKLRDFFLQWLRVEPAPDVSKDREQFPGFDEAIVSDLRTSLDLFLEDVAWGDQPDFRRLFLDEGLYLNGRLAAFYGADLPADAPFQKVASPAGGRAGVLTHPYLMACFAYTGATSPIHRGVFLARGVLGRALRPPPEASAPLAPDLHPGLNTRERVALQTSPQACIRCHSMINPLGFTLENFDAVGRYRSEEKGKPIDATGSYETLTGESQTFGGPRDLATFLAGSGEVPAAFVRQLFQYLAKQPVNAYGARTLPDLSKSFADRGFNVRELVAEIVARSALPPGETKGQAAMSPPSDRSGTPTLGFPADPFAGGRDEPAPADSRDIRTELPAEPFAGGRRSFR